MWISASVMFGSMKQVYLIIYQVREAGTGKNILKNVVTGLCRNFRDNYLCMDRDKTADKAGRCNDSGRKSHGMESSSAREEF